MIVLGESQQAPGITFFLEASEAVVSDASGEGRVYLSSNSIIIKRWAWITGMDLTTQAVSTSSRESWVVKYMISDSNLK